MLCFCFWKAYPRRQTKKNSLATEHKGSGKLAREEVSPQLKFFRIQSSLAVYCGVHFISESL